MGKTKRKTSQSSGRFYIHQWWPMPKVTCDVLEIFGGLDMEGGVENGQRKGRLKVWGTRVHSVIEGGGIKKGGQEKGPFRFFFAFAFAYFLSRRKTWHSKYYRTDLSWNSLCQSSNVARNTCYMCYSRVFVIEFDISCGTMCV